MPDVDPISNPVGFWVFFGVSLLLVIVLAAAPLFWVVSMIRQSRDRPDPKKAAVERQFDQVEAEGQRLDAELEKMREELKELRERRPPTDEPPQ